MTEKPFRFWAVFVEGRGFEPGIHVSEYTAVIDAEEIAIEKGRVVYVLEATKYVERKPIQWTNL